METPDEAPGAVPGEGEAAATPQDETPGASPEDAASGAGETKPRKGAVSSGLKSVWNILAGEGSEGAAADPLEKGSNEETQKKVNELVRLANTSIEKGRVSEALRNVNELITLKPYDADFHFALGLCYRREKKYSEALKKYQDVLDLGGPKALVAILKAEAYAAEGNKQKAFEFLKEAAVGGRNIVNDVSMLPLLTPYQGDTEFIKLALALEKFEITAGKLHDPFTNPFPRPDSKAPGEGAEGQSVVSLSPEEQEKLLHDAKKTYERVQVYIKLEDEAKAMKAYTALRELMKKQDLLTIPKIVNDFRVLMARLEEVEVQIEGIRLKYYYNQAQTKLALMKEAFTEGEYPRVEAIHAEVA
ncbi:MAG TPA: tetratricopeptide repeat protein, partial [Candidatus Methylomirabilis sp.]|nr:tetratricopeptide repeat protein [Candidatus Methylomirabilis sp.]